MNTLSKAKLLTLGIQTHIADRKIFEGCDALCNLTRKRRKMPSIILIELQSLQEVGTQKENDC